MDKKSPEVINLTEYIQLMAKTMDHKIDDPLVVKLHEQSALLTQNQRDSLFFLVRRIKRKDPDPLKPYKPPHPHYFNRGDAKIIFKYYYAGGSLRSIYLIFFTKRFNSYELFYYHAMRHPDIRCDIDRVNMRRNHKVKHNGKNKG